MQVLRKRIVIVKAIQTAIPDLLVINEVFGENGAFESFNRRKFAELVGRWTLYRIITALGEALRGLHYQIRHPQGKLVRVVRGRF